MQQQWLVDGKTVGVEVLSTPSGALSVRINGEPFAGEVLQVRTMGTASEVVVRHQNSVRVFLAAASPEGFEIAHRNARGEVVPAVATIGQAPAGAVGSAELKAPMPGRVVRIFVRAGETVTRGKPLMVIEAMKMENEIKAQRDGVVAEVLVQEGVSVEARAVLLRYST